MSEPLFRRIALIGLGLIGSSLARVAKREGLAGHIAGTARSQATRDKAMALGFLDSVHETPAAAVAGADLVVLCSPLGTYAEIGAAMRDHLATGAIVSDVGSVKGAVARGDGRQCAAGRLRDPRPSDRRHRAVRAGRRLRRAVREPLDPS